LFITEVYFDFKDYENPVKNRIKLIRGTNPNWAEYTDTFEWLSEVELSLNTIEINDDIWQSPFVDEVEKEF
jgi:hypothetical protein